MTTSGRRASRVQILGVPVDPLTVDDLHEQLLRFVRQNARATILHANVQAINLAQSVPGFAAILRSADLVFCDGYGVILAARLLRQHLPERITYADWMWPLAELCAREGLSVYLLGGKAGVAEAAGKRLRDRNPQLRIAGAHDGYFQKSAEADRTSAVIAAINASRPDIVVVGLGMPLQEQWVAEHRNRINARVVLTAGAALDYVSGRLQRPPRWMTDRGLEWLGRLAIEPRRLARRYVLGNPLFAFRVLRERIRRN